MLGEAMILDTKFNITSEEASPGALPQWLIEHMLAQCRDPRSFSEGGPARILILYPTEEARRESLENLADESVVIDRTLHHTLSSLETALLADFRIPRALSSSGGWEIILNEACANAAQRLEFPILNPLEDLEWNEHKTRALAELHSLLARESCLNDWDGPGISTFSRLISKLESQLGQTHPDSVTSTVIEGLSDLNNTPFSLREVHGIILLNHAPMIPSIYCELLLSISKHRPIHQLVNPGNFRLGTHGMLLIDEYSISDNKNLPEWLPNHSIYSATEAKPKATQTRVLVQREEHSISTSIDIIQPQLIENPDKSILLIDPNLSDNRERWKKELSNLGIHILSEEGMASSKSLGHWVSSAAGICHGPNSFALEGLRALAIQGSINLFESPSEHPTDANIRPMADPDTLTELARNEHVLGGPGALLRWLETLSRPPKDERSALQKESTQWFVLCLAKANQSLLATYDRAALDNEDFWIGCHTRNILPKPDSPNSGDEWLSATLSRIDIESGIINSDGSEALPASIIQGLVDARRRLRRMQASTGQSAPSGGIEWVEELQHILSTTAIPSVGQMTHSNVRLLSPADALGCTADIIILANISSSSWNLRVPKFSFLGDEDRHNLNILRPDTPIRQARHHLSHLLAAARDQIIILDPSLDDASPAAAPIREWASIVDPENQTTPFQSSPQSSCNPRLTRSLDGRQLSDMQPPSRSPLNPNAISIPLDTKIQQDISRRRPRQTDDQGYLSPTARPLILSVSEAELLRTPSKSKIKPRAASYWPVIGGIATIDPRPFCPAPTGSESYDSRHGHLNGAEQTVPKWSASRLKEWITCPRRGWLTKGLNAKDEEKQEEDLDPRTHGQLLHEVHHHLLQRVLGMEEGVERSIEEILSNSSPLNIANSNLSNSELQAIALEELAHLAPWLDRTDAVSTNRLRMLTGMTRTQWMDWDINQTPIAPAGRVGTIIESEYMVRGAVPIAYEWEALSHDSDGILISIPQELTSPNQESLPAIRLRGKIDRVDLIPFNDDIRNLIDEKGSDSVAPIRLHDSSWNPRRLVIIRDLKTTESKKSETRHKIGLLEEVQIALYARAWEIAHPGDLVVGAGISVMGHETEHWVETSSQLHQPSENLPYGSRTNTTHLRFRFPDEDSKPNSDPFRAWMAQRLSVALGTAAGAANGRVHPTPSEDTCKYCPVSSTCSVAIRSDV